MDETWPLPREVVEMIAAPWGATDLRVLAAEKNLIFKFVSQDGNGVLRIHTQGERTTELILAEVDWVNYLYRNGVPLAVPLATLDGRMVVRFPLNDEIAAYSVAFREIPGSHPSIETNGVWDRPLIERIGEILGQIHALARKYEPPAGLRRFDWQRQDLNKMVSIVLTPSDERVRETFTKLWGRLQALPRSNGYGLIHGDFHPGNLLQNAQGVTVIDFDNCCYSWYIADIAHFLAMSLFRHVGEKQRVLNEMAADLFRTFMRGYLRFNTLDEQSFEYIPNFLLSFDLIFYLNLRARDGGPPTVQPIAQYFEFAETNLVRDRPGLQVDFPRLYRDLKLAPEGEIPVPAPERPRELFDTLVQIPKRLIGYWMRWRTTAKRDALLKEQLKDQSKK